MKKFERRLRSAQTDERGTSKKKIVAVIFCLVLVLGVMAFFFYRHNRQKAYNACEIVYSEAASMDSKVHYCAYDRGYLVYDCDGARTYTSEGKQLWNIAYDLKNPIVAVKEPYSAIADKGSSTLCIVDGSGAVSRYEVVGKIADVCVAQQGVTAVLTTEEESDHIYLYEPSSSNVLVDIMTKTQKSGMPVTIALSPDGRKLVTSYLVPDGNKLQSWVSFYNFGEVGQNYVDNMVGSYSFEAIVPQIAFVKNDCVVICRDNGLVFYQMSEVPRVIATEDFQTEIKSVSMDREATAVVLKGETKEAKERLLLYQNASGKKIHDAVLDYEYNRMYLSGNDVVFYGGQNMTILDKKGHVRFRTEFSKNIHQIFPVDNLTKYILVSDQSIDVIELKRINK